MGRRSRCARTTSRARYRTRRSHTIEISRVGAPYERDGLQKKAICGSSSMIVSQASSQRPVPSQHEIAAAVVLLRSFAPATLASAIRNGFDAETFTLAAQASGVALRKPFVRRYRRRGGRQLMRTIAQSLFIRIPHGDRIGTAQPADPSARRGGT